MRCQLTTLQTPSVETEVISHFAKALFRWGSNGISDCVDTFLSLLPDKLSPLDHFTEQIKSWKECEKISQRHSKNNPEEIGFDKQIADVSSGAGAPKTVLFS